MNKKSLIVKILSVLLALITVFIASISAFAASDKIISNTVTEEEINIPDEIVKVARAQKGYYPSDINKFTTWFYGFETDSYWCSIFVSWCADQVGATVAVPKRSICDSMRTWFKMRGEYHPADSGYVPQKGDIVFINTAGDGTDNVHHVEIVTQSGFIKSGKTLKVKSIGGNTTDGKSDKSYYVAEKTRAVTGQESPIVGFAHPSYEKCGSLRADIINTIDDNSPAISKYLSAKLIEMFGAIGSFFRRFFSPVTLQF